MTWWRSLPTEARIFALIAAYFVVAAVVYVSTADESAGVTLLLCAAVFGFGYAAWLTRYLPPTQEAVTALEEGDEADGLYLPHESVWPLGLGAGSVLVVTGLAVGLWMTIPGALLAGRSVVGLASESRRRA